MSDLRKAAQQALDALENHTAIKHPQQRAYRDDAIEALRAALQDDPFKDAPWTPDDTAHRPGGLSQQEPVAWMCPDDPERETAFSWKSGHCPDCGKERIPLYTAPPQRQPLTDEEMRKCCESMDAEPLAEGWPELIKFARAIERKVRGEE